MSSDYAAWRDRLAQANDPAFWSIEAIDAELGANRAQFWCDGTSALVTRIVEYPGGAKALEAVAACGIKDGLTGPIEARCEAFSRAAGLTHMKIEGRLGWLKNRPAGWRAHQVVLLKDLDNGQ